MWEKVLNILLTLVDMFLNYINKKPTPPVNTPPVTKQKVTAKDIIDKKAAEDKKRSSNEQI